MLAAAALAFSLGPLLGSPARAADAAPPAAYDAKAAPLDDLSKDLLASSGYELRDDGKVWDKIAETPVGADAMADLLSRLASARRLKALLQLNIVFNRYDSDRHLSDEDREAVRTIARQAWAVFGSGPRRDVRPYFSAQELDALDKIPPYDPPAARDMRDPSPLTALPPAAPAPLTALPPAAAVAASTPTAVSVTALPPPAPAVASSTSAVPVAGAAIAGATAGAAAAATVTGAAAGVAVAGAAVAGAAAGAAVAGAAAGGAAVASALARPFLASAPAAAPRAAPAANVVAVPFSTPSGSTSTATAIKPADPTASAFKAWTPPALSTAAAARAASVSTAAAAGVSAAAVAAPPPAPAAPPAPKPVVIGADEYAKFVADGPYTRESKDMLKLIGARAPDFCLALLRRTVVAAVPQILIDGAKTGSSLRAAIVRDASNPDEPAIVALSPGPVFIERRGGLFSPREALVLPESPEAWAELGVPLPALAAFSSEPPPVEPQNGPWGPTRAFKDGSLRGTYSPQEQAGELLEQLLLIGLRREGFAASSYAARRWTRTAKLMFWSRLKDDFSDAFLDPDRRAELADWLDRSDELDDLLVAGWSSARQPLLDPRRGPPDAQRAYEAASRQTCKRSALADALAEASRRRARRVGLLEGLLDAGLVDSAAAKASAQAATDAESEARGALTAHPPACPADDPARAESLRKSALLLTEAVRAETALRERRAEGGEHASR